MKRILATLGALALLVAPLNIQAADDTLKRDRFGNPVSGGTNGADEIRVFKVNDDGSLDVTIIGGGGGGTVDQGVSGVDTDPWNVMLRNAAGTEIGTATVPVGVSLFDGAGILFGTTANPFGIQGLAADGVAVAGNPLRFAGKGPAGLTQDVITDVNGALMVATDQTGADGVSNSSLAGMITPPGTGARRLGVALYGFNELTWDRIRMSIANGLLVDVTRSVLPTGAATETTSAAILVDTSTIASDTTSIDGKTPALGQAASAASVPVVIASDQSVISVDDNSSSLSVDDGGAVLSVDDAGSTLSVDDGGGSLTVDGTFSLQGDASDLDSDAGVDDHDTIAIGLPAAGGHVVGGTSTNPFRTDPTGTTTQPVSDAGGSLTIDAASLPLPTGAATEATLLTIDADTSALFGTVAGSEQQVDIVGALPAGTNNIGDVDLASSIPAGTNNIGDVDLASSIPAGTNNIGDVDVVTLPTAPANDGVDIGDVTINNAGAGAAVNIQDGGNLISIDDGAGTLTVDDGGTTLSIDDGAGSLTVDAVSLPLPTGAATETTLAAIDVDTSALFGTVAGSEQQVDIVDALPAGTNNIGDVDLASSIPAGTNNIGDVDIASFPDNEPFNVAQIAGTATSVNAGNADVGTQRVVIATDQAVLSIDDNAGSLTIDATSLPLPTGASTEAKQDDNITQVTAIELNTDTGTAMDHKGIVVGTSATLILAADTTRRSVLVTNAFTDLVAIGNSDVTLNTVVATDGFVLATSGAANDGTGGSITLDTTAAVYAIGASASSKVILIWETD